MLREDQKNAQALIGIRLAIDSYIKRRRRLSDQLSLEQFFKKVMSLEVFSASKSATYFG